MSEQYTREQLEQAMQNQQINEAISEPDPERQNNDELINVDEIKKQIRRSLVGGKFVKKKADNGVIYRVWEEPDNPEDRLCNERCIQDIFRTIDGCVNTNISGSYYTGKDVYLGGAQASMAISKKLYIYQKEYGIDSAADAQQIMSIVSNNLKAAIRKAYKGRLLKHSESTRSIRVLERSGDDDSGGSGSGGFLGRLRI